MAWAKQNKPGPETYVPAGGTEDKPAPRGVLATDMPLGRPGWRKPRIKGVPGATGDNPDPEYSPGGGTWHSVS